MKTTFEKASENLERHINKNRIADLHDQPITEEEEFAVLAGKGIEYEINGTKLYIPPVKLYQMIDVKKLENMEYSSEGIEGTLKILAGLIGSDLQFLKDNLEIWHLKEIIELLIYSTRIGSKKLFEKKSVSVSRIIEK